MPITNLPRAARRTRGRGSRSPARTEPMRPMEVGTSTTGFGAAAAAKSPASAAAPARRDGAAEPKSAAAAGTAAVDNVRLALHVDEASGRVVGQVIDQETGDVMRQVPEEEMLRLLAKTREMIGALFNETV